MPLKYSLLGLVIVCSCLTVSQTIAQTKKLESEGDELYRQARYTEALAAYLEALGDSEKHDEIQLKIGITQYALNRLDDAAQRFTRLIDAESAFRQQARFYRARVFQQKHAFREAVTEYKLYLQESEEDDEIRPAVKGEILRCGNGILLPVRKDVIVENLGASVNGPQDDYAPIQSPNRTNRLYFTSVRNDNMGGRRNARGEKDANGELNSDIFYAEIEDGQWAPARSMTALINSPLNDAIWGFSESGQVMYLFKGYNRYSGEFLTDTFKTISNRTLRQNRYATPVDSRKGDGGVFLYNDSTILFSSERSGGFGGRDIYVSVRKSSGHWTKAVNLGPVVNSPYDDDFPYLANDGRTLYFSSNREESMGGMDFFTAQYDLSVGAWSLPKNLGLPLSSSGNDRWFRPASDGVKVYFSSDRKIGVGGEDLYVAYFADNMPFALTDKSEIAFISSASEVSEIVQTQSSAIDSEPTIEFPPSFSHRSLYYGMDRQVFTPTNTRHLESLATYLKAHPDIRLVCVGFSDGSDVPEYDLFFNMKSLEELSDWLTSRGIASSRVHLLATGSNYPMVETASAANQVASERAGMRRMDLWLMDVSGDWLENPETYDAVGSERIGRRLHFFNHANKGLSFRVEIARVSQHFDHPVMTTYPDVLAENVPGSPQTRYTVGMYKSLASALELKKQLEREDLTSLEVRAYIHGFPLPAGEIDLFIDRFPELVRYARYLEE